MKQVNERSRKKTLKKKDLDDKSFDDIIYDEYEPAPPKRRYKSKGKLKTRRKGEPTIIVDLEE